MEPNSLCFFIIFKLKIFFKIKKELFLVPDHTIKDITGASFAGFYYICFQKSTSSIEGFYYHRSSEWYQSLSLNHIKENSTSAYEFR